MHNAAFGPVKMQCCAKSALFKFQCFPALIQAFSAVQVILSALIQDFSAVYVFLSALYQGSALCQNFQDFLVISAVQGSVVRGPGVNNLCGRVITPKANSEVSGR